MKQELVTLYSKKTIHEIRFIISNYIKYNAAEIEAANIVLALKRQEKRTEILRKVHLIDSIIKKHTWFDMEVLKYDGYKLTVVGSTDLCYYHTLEIIFEDIYFINGRFNWTADMQNSAFLIPKNEYELNFKYNIEQDYQLFMFKTDDNLEILVAAANVSASDDTVYRYYKENLKSNERLADFVKNPNT